VSWLHGDLLGSASVATNSSGGKIANSEQRFTPYGSPRLSASGLPTDKTFTGQRVEAGIGGIMDFNARFYDPLIGRFLSADTIVPGAGNPQALNRYAYGFNSPLKYTDPDGHCPMPSAEVGGGGIICFASFIPTPTAQGPGGAIFKGDDRGFSPRSDLTKSKMFIWLNVDTKQVWVGTNASHVALPISPDFGPSPDNKATVSFDEATGEYTIEYEAVIAYPSSDETAARINGTIKFRPDGKGGYESSGERDRYPAAEAYFWSDNPSLNPKAQVQPIFRRLAGQGIQNLYGVEKNPTWLRDRVRDIVTYAAQPEPIDKWSYPSNSCQPGRPC
jgi:RHS repeat-associated protein